MSCSRHCFLRENFWHLKYGCLDIFDGVLSRWRWCLHCCLSKSSTNYQYILSCLSYWEELYQSHPLPRGIGLALISPSLDIMQGKCLLCARVGACWLVFVPVHACIHGLNQLIHLNVWFDLFANCKFGKRKLQLNNPVCLTNKRGNQYWLRGTVDP